MNNKSIVWKQWNTIPGFSKYEINQFGEIRNIETSKILKPILKNKKYSRLYVTLIDDNGNKVSKEVSSLIYLASYREELPKGKELSYIDGNIFNNNINNLQLVDKDNSSHANKDRMIPICKVAKDKDVEHITFYNSKKEVLEKENLSSKKLNELLKSEELYEEHYYVTKDKVNEFIKK